MKNNTDEIGHEGKTQKKKFHLLNLGFEIDKNKKLLDSSCKKLRSFDKNDNNTEDLPSAFTFAAKLSENMSDQPQIYNNSFDSTFNSSSISNFNNKSINDYIDKLMGFAVKYNEFYDDISAGVGIVENKLYEYGDALINYSLELEKICESNNNNAYGISKEIDKANEVFFNIRQALNGFINVNYELMNVVHCLDLDVSIVGNNNVQEHNEDQC